MGTDPEYARGDEANFVGRERVGLGCILHDLVFPEVFVLSLLYAGREHECMYLSAMASFSSSDFRAVQVLGMWLVNPQWRQIQSLPGWYNYFY